ncbi:MAG: glycosyltransferase family 4 protein [Candidatus Daviesbacteria bacterium]|nr:MAG: glycosyltransferase family 4 protein [Candidatus Daviesbacteria bacterium]
MKMSKTNLRIGLYTPYLDTFGGGERYILTIAEFLSRNNQVDILLDNKLVAWSSCELIKISNKRFNLNLSKVNLVKAPLGKGSSLIKRSLFLKQYDFLFYLTDGSVFYSTARNSIIHFQAPLPNLNKGIWGKKKLSSWNLGICNSIFTEGFIKKTWPIKTTIVYPPVDVLKIAKLSSSPTKSSEKKKYILTVGRLLGYKKPKKHQVLIDTFKKLYDQKLLSGWSLHIAGYINESEMDELAEIKKDLAKYPITFYPNYPYEKLLKLYKQSSIYWHSAGFGVEDPVEMEHFGITTVEAMAAGCVPVVINKGGQREIVEQSKNGFLWNDLEELENQTIKLVKDTSLRGQLAQNAIEKAKFFSKENFCLRIERIIGGKN